MTEDQQRAIQQIYKMLQQTNFVHFKDNGEIKLFLGPLQINNISDALDFLSFFRPSK